MSGTPRPAPAASPSAGAGLALPILFILLYLIWGFTYVAIKIGLPFIGALTMAGTRAVIAGLALGAVAWALRRPLPRAGAIHRMAAIVGVLNVAGLAGLMSIGLTAVSAGETSLLVYTQPLQVAVLGALFTGERPSGRQWTGLVIGFAGTAIVLWPRIQPGAAPVWWAYGVLLLGAFAWALSTVLFSRGRRAGSATTGADVIWLTSLQAFYGAVPLLLASLLAEQWRVTPTWELAGALAFTGLLSTGLANLLWFYLLTRRTATVVSTAVFLVPAFAVAFGALVLGEPLTPTLLVGGLLTLVGIALVTTAPTVARPRL